MGFIILKHMLCVDDARVKQAKAVRFLSLSTRPCFFLPPSLVGAVCGAYYNTRPKRSESTEKVLYFRDGDRKGSCDDLQ